MSDRKETVLKVEGMTCMSCVRHVDHALRELEGIEDVEVRLRDGQVRVRHGDACSLDSMVEALRDAGYEGAPST